MKNRYSTLSL